ncbi:MAG: hypothetical protein IPL56_05200 [Saprospiraceae bacterium]|nr:hypothetical protein [Saprospiraceae bacterium]
MYLKQTLGISLIAFYCTLIPMASNGQAYYRNDRLEQRHPNRYTPHRGHVYHNDSRHDYNDRDGDRYRNDRYKSRRPEYRRNECDRNDHHRYRRHRHKSLLGIILSL